MTPKGSIKIYVDMLMTIGLLFVSGYQIWGEATHEWAGAGLFGLFILHHWLNRGSCPHLFRGRFTPLRVVRLLFDLLVLAVMLIQMYSGLVLSRYVFDFLPIESGLALARRLHILGAYWSILLMSLHLGLHWNMILGRVRKRMPIQSTALSRMICTLAGALIAGYGAAVLIKRDFFTYLFLKSEFVFLDYSESAVSFYLDHLAVMGLCIFAAHLIAKCCSPDES